MHTKVIGFRWDLGDASRVEFGGLLLLMKWHSPVVACEATVGDIKRRSCYRLKMALSIYVRTAPVGSGAASAGNLIQGCLEVAWASLLCVPTVLYQSNTPFPVSRAMKSAA